MKSRLLNYSCAATTLLALLIPVTLGAQDSQHKREHHKYKLIDLGTFGGPSSLPGSGSTGGFGVGALSRRGNLVGLADTSVGDPYAPHCFFDCSVAHAFLWENGILTDLGALPGVNTSSALAINARGWIVGFSENGVVDPQSQLPETDAVLWRDGQIVNVGTLGGTQGLAAAVNDRGQVAGAAQNAVSDAFAAGFDQLVGPTTQFPVPTQWRAFLWQDGAMQDLGTLGGPDAAAGMMNERGQVAGESYTNSTPNGTTGLPTLDPFLWDSGIMMDLGGLGGTLGFANWLNSRGQVVGQSNLAGDQAFHPFLWERGILKDLGTLGGETGAAFWVNEMGEVVGFADLPGSAPQLHHGFSWKHGKMTDLGSVSPDPCSRALSINVKGQIVGNSGGSSGHCGASVHGFLWENGSLFDLNILIPPGSGLQLTEALYINDRGEIAGVGVLPNGDSHAVLLVPCDGDHADVEGCDYEPVDLDALAVSAPANSASSPTTANVPKIGSKFAHSVYK